MLIGLECGPRFRLQPQLRSGSGPENHLGPHPHRLELSPRRWEPGPEILGPRSAGGAWSWSGLVLLHRYISSAFLTITQTCFSLEREASNLLDYSAGGFCLLWCTVGFGSRLNNFHCRLLTALHLSFRLLYVVDTRY